MRRVKVYLRYTCSRPPPTVFLHSLQLSRVNRCMGRSIGLQNHRRFQFYTLSQATIPLSPMVTTIPELWPTTTHSCMYYCLPLSSRSVLSTNEVCGLRSNWTLRCWLQMLVLEHRIVIVLAYRYIYYALTTGCLSMLPRQSPNILLAIPSCCWQIIPLLFNGRLVVGTTRKSRTRWSFVGSVLCSKSVQIF